MAKITDDIAYVWDGIKMSADEGWKWFQTQTAEVNLSIKKRLFDAVFNFILGSKQLDDRLLKYVPEDDLRFLRQNNIRLCPIFGIWAGSCTGFNAILVNPKRFKKINNQTICETCIHHEVQHARDIKKFQDKGFSAINIGVSGNPVSGLDKASQLLFIGILEARAYSEQMGFVYEKMKQAETQENKEAYNYFYWAPYGYTFDSAIKKGKTVDQAKRCSAIALLNSDFFKKYYIESWAKRVRYIGTHSFSIDGVLDVFGNDFLNKEDLMKADKFWENISAYKDVKNSKLYQAYLAEKKAMENQNKQPFEKKENTTNSTEKLSNETKNNVIFQTNINVNNAR